MTKKKYSRNIFRQDIVDIVLKKRMNHHRQHDILLLEHEPVKSLPTQPNYSRLSQSDRYLFHEKNEECISECLGKELMSENVVSSWS